MKRIILVLSMLKSLDIQAQDTLVKKSRRYSLHFQETTVSQYRQKFSAPYTGANSQQPLDEWATTLTSTLFGGLRLWQQGQVFVNPEIAGGSGLSSALGIAAFSNGEAFRVGDPKPTIYLARAYFRQLIALGKQREWQEDAENRIAQYVPLRYLSFTAGKIGISDFFDDNAFAHNARTQFLSWGLMSNGAWDYPANTRGYTPSVVLEYVSPEWEARYGFSMLPTTANGNTMDEQIGKANGNTVELKYKYSLGKQAGKFSVLAFYNTAFMGSYTAPNLEYVADSSAPGGSRREYNIEVSRQYGRSKYGYGANLEQNINEYVGMFARASYNDGRNETWCFTEIDRAFSCGIVVKGSSWKRDGDAVGLAYCLSGLSQEHKNYLAQGGLGFIIGDGKLNYASEHLLETYYSAAFLKNRMNVSLTYQLVVNPAYNKDRGPINIYSIRMHFNI